MTDAIGCRVLYIDYEFPGVTTTFTWREVSELTALGVDVQVAATREPRIELLSPEALELRRLLIYAGKTSIAQGLSSLAGLFVRNPSRVCRAVLALCSPVRPLKKYPSFVYHLLWAAYLVRKIDVEQYDIIHAPFAAGQGSMAWFVSILVGRPLWTTSHAYDLYSDRIALKQKLKASSLFVTISEANALWLRERFGALGEKVRVVRLGVDPSEFAYCPPGPVKAVARIVSIGSLNPKKGHDTLLHAVSKIRAAGVNLTCDIVGEGSERPYLESLHEELHLGDSVRLLGSMSNDLAQEQVRGADAFVLACRIGPRGDRDGIPVALMEAMAMGVPVISTQVSGIPELVVDGVTGLLCPPDDVDSLAKAITSLLADHHHSLDLSRRAREHMESEFDLHTNAARLAQLVCECGGLK